MAADAKETARAELRLTARKELRKAERALVKPFTAEASLRIDLAVMAFEKARA